MTKPTSTPPTPHEVRHNWLGPVVMMLCTVVAYIDRQTLAVLSPMILKDTGLSAAAFGETLSWFSVAYMLANPLWGSVFDFIGLRLGMLMAVLIWTIASASHAWVTGFVGFAVARTILGIGEGGGFPGCVKMSALALPVEKRSRGIAIGYSGAALGSLITPLLATPFALRFGWRAAFWVTGALGTAWLIWWWIVARPPIIPSEPGFKSNAPRPKVVLPNPFDRRTWLVFFTYGTGAVALGVIAYMSPLYLNRALGLSQSQLGYILWIPTIGWEIGYFVWGWVSDRVVPHITRPIWVLLMLSALALPSAFVTMFHSWPVVVAFFTWAMFIADGFIVMGLHVGARVFPKEQAGLAGGIGGGSWSAVLAVILPLIGHWIDQREFAPIFITMALLPLGGTLMFLWLSLPWANKPGAAPESEPILSAGSSGR